MKPSGVIILVLVVAVVVAFFSGNLLLVLVLTPILVLGLIAKVLRASVHAPGENGPNGNGQS